MKIKNEIGSKTIDILFVEVDKSYYPSYRLIVKISTEEFNEAFDRSYWVEEDELETFINGLEKLEQTRIGEEIMRSFSPNEFQLKFRNLDNLGHIAVEIQIQKRGNDSYSDFIRVGFEIDPTSLTRIVRELKKMKNGT